MLLAQVHKARYGNLTLHGPSSLLRRVTMSISWERSFKFWATTRLVLRNMTIKTGSGNKYKTESGNKYKTGSGNKYKTGSGNKYNTGSGNKYNTGSGNKYK